MLLEITAAQSEISQDGSGDELRGRDFKRLIGAAVLGTPHENKFKVNSAWKKLRIKHPEKRQQHCNCGRCSFAMVNVCSVGSMTRRPI